MKLTRLLFASTALVLGACASNAPKHEIADSANPQDELTKLDQRVTEARTKGVDVLASGDFKDSAKWLDEAKKDASKNKKQTEILEDLRKGNGYLDRADKTAEQRAPMIPSVLAARQSAMTAGANKFAAQQPALSKIDNDLIDDAGKLDKLNAKEISKYQSRYLDVEMGSIEQDQLGKAKAMINSAKHDDADDKAPISLKKAEIDFKAAENLISTRRGDKDAYAASVQKTNDSASFLSQVVKEIKTNKGLKEASAIEIVNQRLQIASLNKNLDTTMSQNAQSAAQLSNQLTDAKSKLSDSNEKLKGAATQVRIQQAIESARKEFSPQEAEVFQQGDKLVVRLKTMNFSSGRSELPAASIQILGKVTEVAKQLEPKEVVVEGHTDSLGTAEVNQNLSVERAKIVATYLGTSGLDKSKIESNGYGFDRPIASNKTKAGRAQNRRVDIVITPAAAAAENTAAPQDKTSANTDGKAAPATNTSAQGMPAANADSASTPNAR